MSIVFCLSNINKYFCRGTVTESSMIISLLITIPDVIHSHSFFKGTRLASFITRNKYSFKFSFLLKNGLL